jgi:hypothetical protein
MPKNKFGLFDYTICGLKNSSAHLVILNLTFYRRGIYSKINSKYFQPRGWPPPPPTKSYIHKNACKVELIEVQFLN